MTRRRSPTDRIDRTPAFGGSSRRDTAPSAAAADALSTLVGFFLTTVAVGAFAPHAPPAVTLLALWFVGLPAAFGLPAVGARVAAGVRRRLRRFACARWRVGCGDAADPAV